MSLRKTIFSAGPAALLALALMMTPPIPVHATEQEAQGEGSSLFSGFGQNSDEPYEILADQLEVFDAEKYAVLQGNVSVRQGASLLKSPYLKVFYTNSGSGGTAETQGIRRIEARNGVYVESGTQVATGNEADYDAETEEMIMTGNVVLTDDGNVIKGDKLWVNLRTGESRVTADKRIQLILKPNSGQATE